MKICLTGPSLHATWPVGASLTENLLRWLRHLETWPWPGGGAAQPRSSWSMQSEGGRFGGQSPRSENDGRTPDSDENEDALGHYHTSVLPREIQEFLRPSAGKLFLDGTLGAGGHTEALLKAGANVLGLDQDLEALAYARKRLEEHGDHFCALASNFREFPDLLREIGIGALDGILVDLGVSSHQINEAGRGFSWQQDGPLDMRMNATSGSRTAADLVNEESVETLERIFREYGEERFARKAARFVVEQRDEKPFSTTMELAACLERAMPRFGKKIHPATHCFQALRIAVNDELGALKDFLAEAPHWLKPGGRLAVISFHSLEDRLVKHAFQRYAAPTLDRPEWPEPRPNPDYCLRILTKKPLEASAEEIASNPRARSARLRVAERV